MSTLDSSMVNIALPTIMAEFNSPLKETEWVVLIYLLTVTSSLLIWGNLSDRLGKHIIYPFGLFSFALGSLACAYSPSLGFLVGARLCQALGAGMMMSTGPAIIKETFPKGQLGHGLGMVSVAVSLGLMAGPAVGGVILHYFSWRALFWLTVPIGFLFTIIGKALIPKKPQAQNLLPFNWPGATAWACLLTFFCLAINQATSPHWSGPAVSVLAIAATISFCFFYWAEKQSLVPLLPVQLIKKKYYSIALLCSTLSFMVLFAILIMTPFYLSLIMHMNKAAIGLTMMTIPCTVLLIGPIAGWLSDRISAKIISTLGLAASTCGVYLLSNLTSSSSSTEVILKLAVLGVGQSMFLAPNSASLLNRVDKKNTGKSAALLATARNLGMLLGISASSLIFSHKFSVLSNGLDLKDFTPQHSEAFMAALSSSFLYAALIGAIACLLSLCRD